MRHDVQRRIGVGAPRLLHLLVVPAIGAILLSPLAPAAGDDANLRASGEHARAAQMTKAEYRQIREGMSPAKVQRIVGSQGRVEVDSPFCVHRSYSSGSQIGSPPFNRYGVVWYERDGRYQVVGKYEPGQYQTCPPES